MESTQVKRSHTAVLSTSILDLVIFAAKPVSASKPNVLLIVVDDLRPVG